MTQKRNFPFNAFIAYATDDQHYKIVSVSMISAAWLGGRTLEERRQYAVKSWAQVDDTISSLSLEITHPATNDLMVHRSQFRYVSTIGKLLPDVFENVIRKPCFAEAFIPGTRPAHVPVLFSFSEKIANAIKSRSCHILVVPPNTCNDLKLHPPTQIHHKAHDLDDGAEDEQDKDWHRYPWQIALHMTRLSWLLRSSEKMDDVLAEAAAVMMGAETGFAVSETVKTTMPNATTINAWQIRMDMLGMVYDRERLKSSDDICQIHLGADMSPIKGFHWLCAREEALRHTKQNWESGQLGKNFSFSSRRLTPSLVGLGEATVPSIAAHIRRSLFAFGR